MSACVNYRPKKRETIDISSRLKVTPRLISLLRTRNMCKLFPNVSLLAKRQ